MWKQVFLVVLLVLWAHVYADESHEALPVHASAEDAAAVHAAEKRESPVGRQRREGHGHGHGKHLRHMAGIY